MKPIIFSTPMVQAILEGRKTQTRRIASNDPTTKRIFWAEDAETVPKGYYTGWLKECSAPLMIPLKCPYGAVGDTIYVRETFRHYHPVDEYGYTKFDQDIYEFAADSPPMIPQVDADGAQEFNKDGSEKFIPWKPCIHMPQKIARIFLKITDITVERLNDISEADAVAEGVKPNTCDDPAKCPSSRKGSGCCGDGEYLNYLDPSCEGEPAYSAIESFQSLWRSINGEDSWDANPWVWVITFEQTQKP